MAFLQCMQPLIIHKGLPGGFFFIKTIKLGIKVSRLGNFNELYVKINFNSHYHYRLYMGRLVVIYWICFAANFGF